MLIFLKIDCLKGVFPSLFVIFKMYLSIILTNCSSERFFRYLKELKFISYQQQRATECFSYIKNRKTIIK